jgi:hypothetical protein
MIFEKTRNPNRNGFFLLSACDRTVRFWKIGKKQFLREERHLAIASSNNVDRRRENVDRGQEIYASRAPEIMFSTRNA